MFKFFSSYVPIKRVNGNVEISSWGPGSSSLSNTLFRSITAAPSNRVKIKDVVTPLLVIDCDPLFCQNKSMANIVRQILWHVLNPKLSNTDGILLYIDGLVQERRNSIANALEFGVDCTNPSICWWHCKDWFELVCEMYYECPLKLVLVSCRSCGAN